MARPSPAPPTAPAARLGTLPVLADEDYQFIVRLVYERSRISLGQEKRELVSARLGKRLRSLGLTSFRAYCEHLRRGAEDELTQLIDSISTNHTYFFREPRHFDFLIQHVLPEFLAQPGPPHRRFRVWSAASSTGEEPYSIAISLAGYQRPTGGTLSWSLDASDISTRVLAFAKAAVYPPDRVRDLDPERLRRWFIRLPGDPEAQYQVRPEAVANVRFHHLNLFSATYPWTEPFQLIFCRNVMIYFDRATQEQLVARLHQHLAPGGYLFVGHSESLTGIRHPFRAVRPAIYQREPERRP